MGASRSCHVCDTSPLLSSSAAAVTGAGTASMLPSAIRTGAQGVSPSDKIVVGVIGCNGMGFSNLRSLLRMDEVECGALCDVDQSVLERRKREVEEMTSVTPALYADYRQLLENADLDAVVIGTPDHWHCLQMVEACEAGKDVYCEKPLANSVEESGLMVEAAKRYDRIVQVGQWQRSGPHWAEAIDFVHSGKLGRIRTVRAWAYMNWAAARPEPSGRARAGRRRLRHVARSGPQAAVQPQPLPLQLPLVLGLRRRPDGPTGACTS